MAVAANLKSRNSKRSGFERPGSGHDSIVIMVRTPDRHFFCRVMLPLKTHRVEGLIQVQSFKAQSSQGGVM
ncbi:hypothetical protein TNCV_2691661 [Trichonephila clavipes]|uniref:Uncharacterized protein n=1 Tax=Trichonephila clavipes TaxID=2585209 RepID=A0A8X7BAD0_TRICX|nr:hypothetical protein TNCV_2691661 [Trichonephila clavipes]